MGWMVVWMVLILLVLVVFFLTAPSFRRGRLRTPFENRNYAHRGLFSLRQDPPENSLPAFEAAAQAGYGIELDVQFSRDHKLLVFHDDSLDRMTGNCGSVRSFDYSQIRRMPLARTGEHAPLFSEVLSAVAGRVPLIVEIKSRREFSGAYLDALCRATLAALREYNGDYCIESFDPRVLHRIRKLAPDVLRGQLVDSCRSYRAEGAGLLSAFCISHCLGNFLGRPDFIAWCPDQENWAVRLCRFLGAMMVMWTALPTYDSSALEARYQAVIFQWYMPQIRYGH
ncbi:MAG: glycerophosphodiester phosphodiesterase family protein [Gemmiger sp.]|uniref:glycerophosphodiester phosphodiesterase family protein n=1 Tax=Gemmiger sp. TaxID=2049027 RepID=UPI002E77ABC3|nr:glycerophosphodiester phosphodiesterase family protein [Gemmiger sp.]MEE0800128.1 glycerophosphodiester phosphodiesterase family protein [Gemmiger sp.]